MTCVDLLHKSLLFLLHSRKTYLTAKPKLRTFKILNTSFPITLNMTKIFAIEGEWEKTPKSKLSFLPALELLEKIESIPFAYRTAATHQEFYHHLRTAGRNKSFDTLYLAFHGTKGSLWFADGELKILDLAREFAKVFVDKNILISSCQIAKNPEILKEFIKITGAKAVAAYSKKIDFFESTLLDLACLEALNRVSQRKKWKTIMEDEHSWLVKKNGLVIEQG